MKPSAHLRWNAERLLDLVRDELARHAAQRREAAIGLLGVTLLFALSVVGTHDAEPGSAIPSLQALAMVGVLAAVTLWFRVLRASNGIAPRLDDYGDGERPINEMEVNRRLLEARDELLVRARELRAGSHARRACCDLAWWATYLSAVLIVIVLALRWLA